MRKPEEQGQGLAEENWHMASEPPDSLAAQDDAQQADGGPGRYGGGQENPSSEAGGET